jgi:hypothetical protein
MHCNYWQGQTERPPHGGFSETQSVFRQAAASAAALFRTWLEDTGSCDRLPRADVSPTFAAASGNKQFSFANRDR